MSSFVVSNLSNLWKAKAGLEVDWVAGRGQRFKFNTIEDFICQIKGF